MQKFKLFIASFIFLLVSTIATAQVKTEKISVAGECGMCKKSIETAAKKAGASFASWDAETKILTVKYNSSSSNTAKIQKEVAAVGYDTKDLKATDEAYDKLHACCKYERTSSDSSEAKICCSDAKCAQHKCMKDGKCTPGESCCKESGCDQKDCCKKN